MQQAAAAQPSRSQLREYLHSFRMIYASPYLVHICGYLMSSSSISACLYFEKQLAVAAASNRSSERIKLFANINSLSACAIMLLQLTVTVRGPAEGLNLRHLS